MFPIRKIFWNIEQFVVYRILHADDTPHRLALGIGLGFFVAWTPTIGFQMVLVLLLATVFKANRVVGIPVVWISNPLTLVFIYYPNFRVGQWLLGFFSERTAMSTQELRQILSELRGIFDIFRNVFDPEPWQNLGQLLIKFLNVSVDLWVGSVLVGLVLGVLSYVVSYRFIVWYRTHTPRGLRHSLRMKRKEQKNLHEEQ